MLLAGIGTLTAVIVMERTLPFWFSKLFPSVAEANRQMNQYREENSYAQTVNISLSPENLNGRSAMLGFVAGAAAEVVTGQSLVQQFSENPVAVTGAAGLVTLGSMMPVLTMTMTDKSLGLDGSGETQQWTPEAEQLNGRLAMVGLAGMMGLEALTGGPLIPHP